MKCDKTQPMLMAGSARQAKAEMQNLDQNDKDACLDQLKARASLGEHMLVHMEGTKASQAKLKASM